MKKIIALRHLDRVNMLTSFVIPSNQDYKFTHNMKRSKRNVAGGRVDLLTTTFRQYAPISQKLSCDDKCGAKSVDQVSVIFAQTDKATALQLWEDIKKNVDLALSEFDVLVGMPLPRIDDKFVSTVEEPEPAPESGV